MTALQEMFRKVYTAPKLEPKLYNIHSEINNTRFNTIQNWIFDVLMRQNWTLDVLFRIILKLQLNIKAAKNIRLIWFRPVIESNTGLYRLPSARVLQLIGEFRAISALRGYIRHNCFWNCL